MSELDEEIKEVSVLFKDITKHYSKVKELRYYLDHYLSRFEIIYQCYTCKQNQKTKSRYCYNCGKSDIREMLHFEYDKNSNDSYIKPGFGDETARLLKSLIDYYTRILTLLEYVYGEWNIKITSLNMPLSEVYVRIFLLNAFSPPLKTPQDSFVHGLKTGSSRSFIGSLDDFRYTISTIKNWAKEVSTTFDNLKKTTTDFSKETESLYHEHFSFIFTEAEILSKMFKDVHALIENVKDSPFLNKVYQACKKRQSFNIDVHAFNPLLSGKITVTVRHIIDQNRLDDLVNTFRGFVRGVEIFGSFEKYYENMFVLLLGAVENLIRNYSKLFVNVYGPRININMYLDIESTKTGTSAFVGEYKEKYLSKSSSFINIRAHDPSFQNLEINISLAFLLQMIEAKDIQTLTEVLIHELTHLFDTKLIRQSSSIEADKIRKEGIAVFSEFVYARKSPIFSKVFMLIEIFIQHPISSWEDDYCKKRSHSHEYLLGEFMCFVFFVALLKRRFGVAINILEPGFEKQILENPEFFAYAQVVLRYLSSLSTKDFFRLHIKYSNELGLKPIVTPEGVENI